MADTLRKNMISTGSKFFAREVDYNEIAKNLRKQKKIALQINSAFVKIVESRNTLLPLLKQVKKTPAQT